MPSRLPQLESLMKHLRPQITDGVEIIVDSSMNYNIGKKRNILLAMANGEYIVFVDDDDWVAPNYVSLIVDACNGCDCVGISGYITTNGQDRREWYISRKYTHWYEANGVYYRTPNHISPVRRELAMKAGFPEISNGEDHEYSKRLHPLLNTEVKIEQALYHYQYRDPK